MVDEKRRFSRIIFNIEARLVVDRTIYRVAKISNLSIGGGLVEIDGQLPLGTRCTFIIVLAEKTHEVEVVGEIVRVKGREIGLKFTSINPESLFHLQNIIRYNAEDPELIEQEITVRPGLK